MTRSTCVSVIVLLLTGGCAGSDPADIGGTTWENLTPVANANVGAPEQPARQHPYAVAITDDGHYALVTMRGSELEPGTEVVVIDVEEERIEKRLDVGARPVAVAIRPQQDFAIVLSQLSPYAAVIELSSMDVAGRIEVGFYAEDLLFSPDGRRLFVSSRATDEVVVYTLHDSDGSLTGEETQREVAGVNPGAMTMVPSANKLYVTDAGGLGVRVFDSNTLAPISFIFLNSPVFDVERMGSWVVATTLGGDSGLPCVDDADYPGAEGDGVFEHITDQTCGRGFADIQNEIAFIDPGTDFVAARYTSDTAEVSEADREGDHDPDMMRVVGALPHTLAVVDSTRAFITMGASFEVVQMLVEPGRPPEPPSISMERTWATGMAPRGVATDRSGSVMVVAEMLGETVSIIDPETSRHARINVGLTSPPFPATSAEIGELYFFSSGFSTDGDQSCSHCHPDADSDGKTWGVGVVRAYGRRATMVTRNLHETQPLLIEGVFDENDFTLEMEGMSFRPDYHDSSYAVQVSLRDDHFRSVSRQMMGRDLGFDEVAAHLADYLVVEPRLLPSPFPGDSEEAERGEALFSRPDVGCAGCHPAPTFASPDVFSGVTTLARFDRPRRDLDPDISVTYIENARDGFFNANSLRGGWDRRGAFLHDGRARTLRETILTPGHACLEAGEIGFNEFEGRVDTNGGVSHLRCDQIDDLVAFLRSID